MLLATCPTSYHACRVRYICCCPAPPRDPASRAAARYRSNVNRQSWECACRHAPLPAPAPPRCSTAAPGPALTPARKPGCAPGRQQGHTARCMQVSACFVACTKSKNAPCDFKACCAGYPCQHPASMAAVSRAHKLKQPKQLADDSSQSPTWPSRQSARAAPQLQLQLVNKSVNSRAPSASLAAWLMSCRMSPSCRECRGGGQFDQALHRVQVPRAPWANQDSHITP